MKRPFFILLIFFIMVNTAGCEAFKKKFTRKKKEPVRMPRIYQVKKYEKKPTPELYKKHYSYWAGWQAELVEVLGENHKKDSRCIEEIVGNLRDMQSMLVKEKADELNIHIEKLIKVKDIIFREDAPYANKNYIKMTLDREERFIKRQFYYDKVRNSLKTSFEETAEEPKDETQQGK